VIDAAFAALVELTSVKQACGLLGKSRAPHYRRQRPTLNRPRQPNAHVKDQVQTMA
jgi:hypothetical protein